MLQRFVETKARKRTIIEVYLMSYFLLRLNKNRISSQFLKTARQELCMDLICCVCKNEISEDAKIAKIISIKRIQHYGTDARIEYTDDQEDIYVHIDCLTKPQNNISICDSHFGIINKADEILCPAKNEKSLIRNNLLGFLNE